MIFHSILFRTVSYHESNLGPSNRQIGCRNQRSQLVFDQWVETNHEICDTINICYDINIKCGFLGDASKVSTSKYKIQIYVLAPGSGRKLNTASDRRGLPARYYKRTSIMYWVPTFILPTPIDTQNPVVHEKK